VTAEVSGRIVEAAGKENQVVAAGDVFLDDDRPTRSCLLPSANADLLRRGCSRGTPRRESRRGGPSSGHGRVAFNHKQFDRQQGLLAKHGHLAGAYDQAEQDLHTAQQGARPGKEHEESTSRPRATRRSRPTITRWCSPRRQGDQAALDLANTVVSAPAAASLPSRRLLVDSRSRRRSP